jgi:transposase
VDLQVKEMKVTLKLTHQPLWRFRCPECDEECPTHDHRQRKWRHLDTCGYVTMIEADVPRVDCPKHGGKRTVPLTARETIEGADQKICFDRFHVAAYFGKALGKIRATEHRELGGLGISPLTRTRHDWLRTKAKNEYKDKRSFLSLTRLNLKRARAWRIKEAANGLWSYSYRGVAERNWKSLLGWISRSRLEPMIKVGRMVKTHLWGILNAIQLKATNAIAESVNATIQKIKARACGYRNRARLRTVILFHKGGLSLLPAGISEG